MIFVAQSAYKFINQKLNFDRPYIKTSTNQAYPAAPVVPNYHDEIQTKAIAQPIYWL